MSHRKDRELRILRRLGPSPKDRPYPWKSDDNATCPEVFELHDGRFGIMGTTVPAGDPLYDQARAFGAQLGADARMVIVPGGVLGLAKPDIPDA